MYAHILIATDGSEVASRGVDHGLSLARSLGARVTVLTVTDAYPLYAGGELGLVASDAVIASHQSQQAEAATTILDSAKQAASSHGVSVDTVHVPDAPAAEAIIEAASARSCDLIVMGSHGRRGLGRLVLGSKAWEVASHSTVPVLIVR